MVNPDANSYLDSLALEISSQSTRVRQLIGGRHWPTDGAHKESLVATILARHMPVSIKVSSGFSLSPANLGEISEQLDVTLIDNRFAAPLLDQSGFSIVAPSQLAAAISVKSIFSKKEFVSTLDNLLSVKRLQVHLTRKAWLGGIFFDEDTSPSQFHSWVCKWYDDDQDVRERVDSLANADVIIASTGTWLAQTRSDNVHGTPSAEFNFFDIGRSAFAVMLGHLIGTLSERLGGETSEFEDLVQMNIGFKHLGGKQLHAPS